MEHNWSRNILVMQIESRLMERSGGAVTNFALTLPKPEFDLARESLKDPNKVVAEYALRGKDQPLGVAEYQLVESLPAELRTSLPSIEQIERELAGDDEKPTENQS